MRTRKYNSQSKLVERFDLTKPQDFEAYRDLFLVSRKEDSEGNPLNYSHTICLNSVSDKHLENMLKGNESGKIKLTPTEKYVFIAEQVYREFHELSIPDYEKV